MCSRFCSVMLPLNEIYYTGRVLNWSFFYAKTTTEYLERVRSFIGTNRSNSHFTVIGFRQLQTAYCSLSGFPNATYGDHYKYSNRLV